MSQTQNHVTPKIVEIVKIFQFLLQTEIRGIYLGIIIGMITIMSITTDVTSIAVKIVVSAVIILALYLLPTLMRSTITEYYQENYGKYELTRHRILLSKQAQSIEPQKVSKKVALFAVTTVVILAVIVLADPISYMTIVR